MKAPNPTIPAQVSDRDQGITRLAGIAAEIDRAATLTGVTIRAAQIRLGRFPQAEIHNLTHQDGMRLIEALGVVEVTVDHFEGNPDAMAGHPPFDVLNGVYDGIQFLVYVQPASVQ